MQEMKEVHERERKSLLQPNRNASPRRDNGAEPGEFDHVLHCFRVTRHPASCFFPVEEIMIISRESLGSCQSMLPMISRGSVRV